MALTPPFYQIDVPTRNTREVAEQSTAESAAESTVNPGSIFGAGPASREEDTTDMKPVAVEKRKRSADERLEASGLEQNQEKKTDHGVGGKSLFSIRPVELHVGAPAQIFFVHWNLICERSSFFNWKQASEEMIRLPDDDPRVVDTYLQTVYFGRFHVDADDMFWKAYIFGEKIQDTQFKNAIIDVLFSRVRLWANLPILPSDLRLIYNNTPEGSKIRKFVVDGFLHTKNPESLRKMPSEQFPSDFLRDLAVTAMGATRDRSGFTGTTSCTYHDHDEGSNCGVKKA